MCVAVCYGTLEFLHYYIGLVKQRDKAVYIFVRFAHLLCRILQAHYTGAALCDVRIGHLECRAVDAVEALCDVSCKLQVLLLIRR